MCDNGKYGPVGYAYNADVYCMDSTADIARGARMANDLLRVSMEGKKTVRVHFKHETLFLRGRKITAKRYDKRGRMVSKRVLTYNAYATDPECQGAECMLDMWASIMGIKNRLDEYSFDSGNFPKAVLYHDACQDGHEICGAFDCDTDLCNP